MKELTMLFKPKPEEQRRSITRKVRLTQKEDETITEAAEIRRLDVSEFIRRAALGRKADVRYEYQIILELRAVVEALRAAHREFIARGMEPPKEAFSALIQEAIEAMRRISK